jgi:pYEATS domain-containing protein involved in immunity
MSASAIDNANPNNEGRVLARGLAAVVAVGLAGIALYALSAPPGGAGGGKWLSYVGLSLLLASASFVMGGMFGFLFGLPKSDDKSANTSLEQISDWLTKILVGVGLAQLTVLPSWAWRVAKTLAQSFDGSTAAAGFVLSLAVFHTIAGFMILYLWARREAPGFFKLLQEKKELEVKSEKLEKSLEVERLNVEETQHTARGIFEQATKGQSLPIRPAKDSELPAMIAPRRDTDDPWKGQFGGQAEANGRKLSAQVRPRLDNDELFDVQLRVESIDKGKPLQGVVVFYLHPTFPDDKILVEVRDGVGDLSVTVWGAFTVGAVADGGATLLELDLSDLKDAPQKFKDR